jgi:hypothetical protein
MPRKASAASAFQIINAPVVIIKKAKISSQIIKLREHLSEQGMTNSEFKRYADDHHLEKKLNDNIKLLDLSVEKLPG